LRKGRVVGERFQTVRGVLVLLKTLSEGPASTHQLGEALSEAGVQRDERTVRRWLEVMREEGFGVRHSGRRHELTGSPVRIALGDYEALATLSVLESLAQREPVYGEHLASATKKLREAIPDEALRFADSGKIEFSLDSASDPPEDPNIIDTLRRATHRSQKARVLYFSLRSGSVRWRTVEPVRVAYVQRAHRLFAYEREQSRVTEFRINRIHQARLLPEKFAPEAHRHAFEPARVRLSKNAFTAYGKAIIPDDRATIEPLEDGGAIIEGRTPSVFWTVREVAALGPDAEVLDGPELKRQFTVFLEQTLKKYE
jgi:predicted DNA-binding transcriptional regulator YafY